MLTTLRCPILPRFTTPGQWLNDPNGPVFLDGTYHTFFQKNPNGHLWGDIGWGHAISDDLVTWIEEPVALTASENHMIFSGSTVVDTHNTSGFSDGSRIPLVACYTQAARGEHGRQAQALAYSLDAGSTWTPYDANPVLDLNSSEFRDPKLLWYEPQERWIMVVAHATDHQVGIYSSANLKDWTAQSRFGPAQATGGVWECPDLIALPDSDGVQRWIMIVSINPGGPHHTSAVQYWIGDFDGHRFTPCEPTHRDHHWIDWGHDYYAPQSFTNTRPGEATTIAWGSNWQTALQLADHGYQSGMTFARSLELDGSGDHVILRQRTITGSHNPGGEATAILVPSSGQSICLSDQEGRSLWIDVDLPRRQMSIDRSDYLHDYPELSHWSRSCAPLESANLKSVSLVCSEGFIEVSTGDDAVKMSEIVPGACEYSMTIHPLR